MKIASDDVAGIITAIGGFLTVVGGIATNLWLTIRQGRVQRQHGEDIKDLKASSGTFKALTPDHAP